MMILRLIYLARSKNYKWVHVAPVCLVSWGVGILWSAVFFTSRLQHRFISHDPNPIRRIPLLTPCSSSRHPIQSRCPSSILLGMVYSIPHTLAVELSDQCSRSMSRAPRGPKRSPTPTSATFPPSESGQIPPVPPSPRVSAANVDKPLYLCSPFVEAALVKGNFKTIVMLPKYVDIMEWVAVNSE